MGTQSVTAKQFQALANIHRAGFPNSGVRVMRNLEKAGLAVHDIRHGRFYLTEKGAAVLGVPHTPGSDQS